MARCALAMGMAALMTACASSLSGPRLIHVRDLPVRPVLDLEWVQNDRSAAAVAMAVMEQELQLPRLDVTLIFLQTARRFRPPC